MPAKVFFVVVILVGSFSEYLHQWFSPLLYKRQRHWTDNMLCAAFYFEQGALVVLKKLGILQPLVDFVENCRNAASADMFLYLLCQKKTFVPWFSSSFSHRILLYRALISHWVCRLCEDIEDIIWFCFVLLMGIWLNYLSSAHKPKLYIFYAHDWCGVDISSYKSWKRLSCDFAQSKLTLLKMKLCLCECCFSASFVR